MRGKRFSNGPVLEMVGTLAICVGAFLAITLVRNRLEGSAKLLSPESGSVGAVALLSVLTGVGICRQVRLTVQVLCLAMVTLAGWKLWAGITALGWVPRLQHTLCAAWLCGGALVLWLHRKELG